MKIAIAVLTFVFTIFQISSKPVEQVQDVSQNQLSPLQETCLKELKLIEKRHEFVGLNSKSVCPEDNPEYNNFISCYWKKTGRQEEDGSINYEKIKAFITQGITQALGTDSTSLKFADKTSTNIITECQKAADITAIKIRNCIANELNKLGQQ